MTSRDKLLLCVAAIMIMTVLPTMAIEFTSSPGLHRVVPESGASVSMVWTMDTVPSVTDIIFFLNPNDVVMVRVANQYPTYLNGYDGLLEYTGAGTTLSILLKYPSGDDHLTGDYTCRVDSTIDIEDKNGALYHYSQPTRPTLSAPYAPEGSRAIFTCNSSELTSEPSKYRPNPPQFYHWIRDDVNITETPLDRHSTTGNQLTVSGVQKNDGTFTYKCTSHENGGGLESQKSDGVSINVQYKPGTATPRNPDVGPHFERHNQDILLECVVDDDGNPTATFTWAKDGVIKATGSGSTYTIPSGTLSVTDHDGVWTCTPTNTVGDGTPGSINVTVYATPKITDQKPPSEVTVIAEEETSLNIPCEVSGRPAPSVTWSYNGGGLPTGVMTSRTESTDGKLTLVTETLTWSDTSSLEERRQTGGTYTCTGTVEDRETDTDVQLNVEYGPYDKSLEPPGDPLYTYTQTEGESLTLTCSALCEPDCVYTWFRDSTKVSDDDVLTFSSLDREDHDQYRCEITNGRGEDKVIMADIVVNYSPDVSVTSSITGDIPQGSDVTFTCVVDSRPVSSSITWQNVTGQSSPMFNSSGENTTHIWGMIHDIDILDSGVLRCVANNGIGQDQFDDLDINVIGPPRPYQIRPESGKAGANPGSMVTFSVSVIANPLPTPDQWNWTFEPDNASLNVNSNPGGIEFLVSGDLAVLLITNVTSAHYGNYTITAGNSLGELSPQEFLLQSEEFYQTLPGAARAAVGPHFERHFSDVTLKCALDDYGNPPATFTWTRDEDVKATGAGDTYIIPSGTLSVTEHDGLWKCTPVNAQGSGLPGNIIVTAYALPLFYHPIPPADVIADAENKTSLNLPCAVSGRPQPSVTWSYNGGCLPTGVMTSHSNSTDDKLTLVTETLTWRDTSSLEERRQTGGTYMCTGMVEDRHVSTSVLVVVH